MQATTVEVKKAFVDNGKPLVSWIETVNFFRETSFIQQSLKSES